jgi:hypothetical protein
VVLAEGRLVGQACAEAHPAEVMDLTFATQALAVEPATSWPPSGSAATTSPPPRRATSAAGVSAPDRPAVQAARLALRPVVGCGLLPALRDQQRYPSRP